MKDDGRIDAAGCAPAPVGDPVVAFARERRLHAQAYDHWVSLLRGRRMPALSDLDPAAISGFAGQSVLLLLVGQSGAPTIAFLGRDLREEADIVAARPTLEDVPGDTMLAELLRRLPDIVAYAAPVGFEAEFTGRSGTPNLHRGILLPLADDNGALAAIYGVISWKALTGRVPPQTSRLPSRSPSRPSGASPPPAPGRRWRKPIARRARPASTPRSAPLTICCSTAVPTPDRRMRCPRRP
jgi:hypothetical protein